MRPKNGFSTLPDDQTPNQAPNAIDKIKSLNALVGILAELKSNGETIVQCHGVFDLLHPGHIRHLAEARRQGSILVVTVTADGHVNKGPGRPVFEQALRAETLASLESVDFVAINESPSAVDAIKKVRPDVYVKGSDYADPEDDITGKIVNETETVAMVGGRIYFTSDITFSSSSLINQHVLSFSPETERWLAEFRTSHSGEDALNALESISDLNVLIVGEAIIDEYVFCSGLGKAAKDPMLAFLHESKEVFAGGSLAVANHLGDFCKRVEIVSLVGEVDSHEKFIRDSLHPKVKWHGITHRGAPSLCKRRFVDDYTGSKLFELYIMDDSPLDAESERSVIDTLGDLMPAFDLVIVPDYGHGLMTSAVIDLVTREAKFLAVNTQANAGNRGFNTISKYPRADYVCLAGHEVDLETRMRHVGERDKLLKLASLINCPRFTVTLGRSGSIHYERGGEIVEAPAVAPKIVDRVGAGDAVLAVTSALVAVGAPWDITALIGNAAGAELVAELGNRVSLSKAGLSKHLISLLK